jgi:hypothetical protein
MFIAMNRFRVKKKVQRTHLKKYGWTAIRIWIAFQVSWSFICSGVRRRKTTRSIPRIPCGKASGPSRRGRQRSTDVSLQSRLGPIAATKRNPEPST